MAKDDPAYWEDDEPIEPGTPGVAGEHPNAFEPPGPAPLDEAPFGHTPAEPTRSAHEDSLPPGCAPRVWRRWK